MRLWGRSKVVCSSLAGRFQAQLSHSAFWRPGWLWCRPLGRPWSYLDQLVDQNSVFAWQRACRWEVGHSNRWPVRTLFGGLDVFHAGLEQSVCSAVFLWPSPVKPIEPFISVRHCQATDKVKLIQRPLISTPHASEPPLSTTTLRKKCFSKAWQKARPLNLLKTC